MTDYQIYWGENHDNTFQFAKRPTDMAETLKRAASHLDFYAAAYYTACAEAFEGGGHPMESDKPHKLILEGWKPQERIDREWVEVQDATRRRYQPGTFVTFPGYEWQGDGSGGDHNVAYREEGPPVHRVDTLAELYACLQPHDAIAIPHHTAYRPGVRGRDWSVYDERLTPFAELFSCHGCSETDEEWVGLRLNSHMGPGFGPGTYQAALDRGHHIGAICSTDNWGEMPGRFGQGRMACLATELTRDALWEAFRARRVYGVTGDRIELDIRVGDAMMGEIVSMKGPRPVRIRVRGSDAIDRIELLRNGRVIATHCHQGTWDLPGPGQRSRFKIRIEAGWGPRATEMDMPDREWRGRLHVGGGRVLGFEPCWITPGQGRPIIDGESAAFDMLSSTKYLTDAQQNANVFEIEADAAAPLALDLNGLEARGTVAEFAACSRELWYRDECVRMLAERAGIEPESPERQDIYHHVAFKAKMHRVIPESGYTAALDFEDDEPIDGEVNYRVRVEQRNGQRAWSSPIWVRRAS